ncbi:hypothetical protein SDC9_108636 [bioreactor metagenome]|uniref:Uncharacterized protein n=1 Tax=bioreactor metagenome TaxID=1076179 RepID=A0A645B9Q2_9ZZZZ
MHLDLTVQRMRQKRGHTPIIRHAHQRHTGFITGGFKPQNQRTHRAVSVVAQPKRADQRDLKKGLRSVASPQTCTTTPTRPFRLGVTDEDRWATPYRLTRDRTRRMGMSC